MQRGPLPEEIEVAQAELLSAQAAYELREVRASFDGVILHVYRHTGGQSLVNWPTPILKMADTNRLQVRLEVGEADAYQLRVGRQGSFTIFGMTNTLGRLTVQKILPVFGPKRLFDPDGNARQDTRTLAVLCAIAEQSQPVFPANGFWRAWIESFCLSQRVHPCLSLRHFISVCIIAIPCSRSSRLLVAPPAAWAAAILLITSSASCPSFCRPRSDGYGWIRMQAGANWCLRMPNGAMQFTPSYTLLSPIKPY